MAPGVPLTAPGAMHQHKLELVKETEAMEKAADDYNYIANRLRQIQYEKQNWESYHCETCDRTGWQKRRYKGGEITVPCKSCYNPFDLPNPDPLAEKE